ncbi:MAG: AMP-binding protein, partial [Pseudomonadota bacterium]
MTDRGPVRAFLDGRTGDAILAPGRPELGYAALAGVVDGAAAELAGAGIGPGDAVAIVLPNGPEMAVAFLAVASVATAAPLNPAYTEEEFA